VDVAVHFGRKRECRNKTKSFITKGHFSERNLSRIGKVGERRARGVAADANKVASNNPVHRRGRGF